MSKSTISTFELFQMFPDQESARVYFEARRWPDGATCPACGEAMRIGTRKPGYTGYGPSGHGPAWCAGSSIPYCSRR